MTDARDAVRARIAQAKTFLAQEKPPRLSESDTKAHFIDPIITALGWEGIGVVMREYYVRNSQEFIDYVMRGPQGLLLAVEAKPLQMDLTDKHAAQLIQYCAVEGIEWAALTNGRELQFFNTFLKPDLAAKRVLRLDLLAFNTDEEFDALFGQIWQLSRESMSEPTGVRTWLNQQRMDTALRAVLLDPTSTTVRSLRRLLAEQEISASTQDLVLWFRRHLGAPVIPLPSPTTQGAGATTYPTSNTERSAGQSRLVGGAGQPSKPNEDNATAHTGKSLATSPSTGSRTSSHYGVTLRDLVEAGLLPPGTLMTLIGRRNHEATHATVNRNGELEWQGARYSSPSSREFIQFLGWPSMNGWLHWHADLPSGRVPLQTLRERYLAKSSPDRDTGESLG